MSLYSVSARGIPAIKVEASNWISALGEGLQRLRRDTDLQRLACEVLPNGTVIARDVRSGTGYIVAPAEDEPLDTEEIEIPPEELAAMRSLLDEIQESDNRAEACQLALEIAQELVPAESGAVMVEDKGMLRFVAVAGPKAEALVGGRLPIDTGVAGVCFGQRRVIVLGDAGDDPRHCADIDDFTGYETREMIAVPVVAGDRSIGVLELLNLPRGQRFNRLYVRNLVSVAEALGDKLSRL